MPKLVCLAFIALLSQAARPENLLDKSFRLFRAEVEFYDSIASEQEAIDRARKLGAAETDELLARRGGNDYSLKITAFTIRSAGESLKRYIEEAHESGRLGEPDRAAMSGFIDKAVARCREPGEKRGVRGTALK